MFEISIDTDPALSSLPNHKSKAILAHTLKQENIESCDISIIFGNKDLLRNLKKQFFDVDQYTDVIAFRLNDYGDEIIEGEIYICLPVAEENAVSFNEPIEREIARLIIHGGLHLLGYDDDTEANRIAMSKLEDKYLKEL